MKRFLLTAVLLGVLMLTGCASPGQRTGPLVPAYTSGDFDPNYGGDLQATQIWPATGTATSQSQGSAIIVAPNVVTYRIVGSQSANVFSIDLSPTTALDPTTEQRSDIEGAIAKWQAALGTERTLREVGDGVRTANIEIMVVNADQIPGGDTGPVGALGHVDPFADDATGFLARTVVKIAPETDERNFRLIALHEMGHSLFAVGHSRHTGDIMFGVDLLNVPVVGIGDIDLTDRDVNTIRAAYWGR